MPNILQTIITSSIFQTSTHTTHCIVISVKCCFLAITTGLFEYTELNQLYFYFPPVRNNWHYQGAKIWEFKCKYKLK